MNLRTTSRHTTAFFLVLSALLAPMRLAAQADSLRVRVDSYFDAYRLPGFSPSDPLRPTACCVDSASAAVRITLAEAFVGQPLTADRADSIYAALRALLAPDYAGFSLELTDSRGRSLREHVPNRLRAAEDVDRTRLWPATGAGRPWTENVSCPWRPAQGLYGRHIFVWPSHGRFWHEDLQQWRWQRPRLFATCEDLLSQSFVYPLLVPMLERAGAVVALPRERDGQTAAVVVDNDTPERPGGTYNERGTWTDGARPGFALPLHRPQSDSLASQPPVVQLRTGENPFMLGTSRHTAAAPEGKPTASARWTLCPPRDGRYAVYVSYATEAGAVDDARYTVCHAGGATVFRVNQRMGGGTWVYLGSFFFSAADDGTEYVELTNESACTGRVSADAVRIGGGMGITVGADSVASGLPASLECATAYAQWAGMPENVYCSDAGRLGYDADIRTRSNMLARLGGTSPFQPDSTGLGVPFELSVALHTDAGICDGQPVGMLAIATTEAAGDTIYASGLNRMASLDLGDCILAQIQNDLGRNIGMLWPNRGLLDRNYGETRSPRVPAVIVEMLSHQNFEDMKLAHDPHFKFLMARAIYKAILRYTAFSHGQPEPVVQPLPPHGLSALLSGQGDSVRLSWCETTDTLESSAQADAYIVYTGDGRGGFDNGRLVRGACHTEVSIERGRLYAFRVTAVNAGGESLPSATAACFRATGGDAPEVLVVDGFDRLSGPARVDNFGRQGFDLDADLGVPAGSADYFCGRQQIFDTELRNSWGRSGNELEGQTIAGNTRDYAVHHGLALAATGRYSFSSAEVSALTSGDIRFNDYAAVDYIAGLNRSAPHNLRSYRALPAHVRRRIQDYMECGGRLLLSGAYIGSDMTDGEEKDFCRETLYYIMGGAAADTTEFVRGLGLDSIPLVRRWNNAHYAATRPDIILPAGDAFSVFTYGDGTSAGIACRIKGKNEKEKERRVVALGFPVECIADDKQRSLALDALLRYLTK
ncbi:MAG: N-acetylmuramoyl-L-alanine amidase [Prevotellaceae bacterium]|nr:N-acetylmuramoyl-L-alanine amidase [Prevotellaceae bacterium]